MGLSGQREGVIPSPPGSPWEAWGICLVERGTKEHQRQVAPSPAPSLTLFVLCVCFPSTEPGIFPPVVFSSGTLDHPGMQSRRQVPGTV